MINILSQSGIAHALQVCGRIHSIKLIKDRATLQSKVSTEEKERREERDRGL